jgi:hypothetical protein
MSINLHIEKLVLDGLGVRPDQECRVRTAIGRELTRLMRQDTDAAGTAFVSAQHESVRHSVAGFDPEPEALGRQIGKAIFKGVTG